MLTVTWLALAGGLFHAEPPTMAQAAEIFEAKSYQGKDGGTLLYRYLEPASVVDGATYPLVIFLHGAGERGADNLAPLRHGMPNLIRPEFREQFPCYAIAPQCPTGKRWVEVDWSAPSHTTPEQPSDAMALLVGLIDQMQESLPIDRDRIYVTGLSMGGYGTWDLIARHPDRFAAAIPICGGADLATADRIKHLPVWVFHGDKDQAVKVERSRNMIDALKKVGSSAKYTEYAGVGHDSWSRTYANPEVWVWLFSQKRSN